ncbi:LPS export ABC transporter permease LptF [Sphingomonas xanthus]|uniref:LPS export ABC transporter permease LptF n=1 Tax=Sphingomonas xanthus TaxID=2594473 RepID=A0A516ISN9_9SPHN|nr:LPS export ABC transporter permease LptF [Sphingomonas xanthus]QDP19844.1 LPS export ABC transporter permease LptF [Sphingomonas xanthus]
MVPRGRKGADLLALVDRYLARNIAVPLIGTLVLAAMLLVLDKMLRLFDFVISAGGPVRVVWQMLANMLPEYFSLGIPIGLLLGILLAFRKLALSSELDALRGIGVGYTRLLRVPYMYTVALLLLNIAIVGWLDPYARYRYEGLRFDLKSGALGASIKVGEFTDFGKRMTLRIERSEDDGTKLMGIFTALDDKSGMRLAATAAEGQFLATDDPDTIIFRLRQGRLVQDGPKFATPRTLSFDSYDLPINLPAIDPFRNRGNQEKELTLPEVASRAYAGTAESRKDERAARANLHFRLVEIAMMLMLPLLAVALAVPPKRSHSSLGIFVGIVMVVTYHKINQYAESAGAQGRLQPELALWLPFLGLVALIAWMYHVIAHRPGGQPIGALEAAFAKLGRAVRRMLPKRRFERTVAAA